MTPYLRADGPIGGHLPRTEKPGLAKPGRFEDAYEPDPAWREQAVCADYSDKNLWFPIGDTGPALVQIEEAKAICNNYCPVRDACRQWALDVNEPAGVWGGLSEKERASLKRSLSRKSRAVAEQEVQAAA